MYTFIGTTSFLIFLGSLLLGIFIYSKNPKGRIHRAYFIFALSISLWSFSHWRVMFATTTENAMFWQIKFLNPGSIFIPVAFFGFVIEFLNIYQKNKKILFTGYTIAVILTIINIFSHFLTSDMVPKMSFNFWPNPGNGYTLFLAFFFAYTGYGIYLLIKEYIHASRVRKNQMKYILLGIIIGFAGGSTNYPLWYDIPIPPIGHPLVFVYVVSFAYAIIKYRALEIETVIHKTFLYFVISSFIFIPIGVFMYFARPFLTNMNWYQLGIIFTVLFFLFKAYHTRMQPYIDHIFRRRIYDYQFLLKEIPSHIAGILDIDSLSNNLLDTLKDTLYPQKLLLMVKNPQDQNYRIQKLAGYDPAIDLNKSFTLEENHPVVEYSLKNREILEKEILQGDPKYSSIKDKFLEIFEKCDIQLFLPLVIPQEDKLVGFMGLGKRETLRMYTTEDIKLLSDISPQIAVSVDNSLYHEDILEKQGLLEQIAVAKNLQQSLLPPNPQEPIAGISIYGLLHPAKEVGGDYYDFIYHKPQESDPASKGIRLGVTIGDVSGKGVDAGIIMAMTKTTIFTLSLQENLSPKEILRRTNRILYYEVNQKKFVSLLYFSILPQENKITYSAAGHEHILVYRASTQEVSGSARMEVIKSGGIILGMEPDIERFLEEHDLELRSGDKILLYTDGVTEARNPGEEFYGLERLVDSFQSHAHLALKDTIHNVYKDIKNFISTREQYDDITLVGIQKE